MKKNEKNKKFLIQKKEKLIKNKTKNVYWPTTVKMKTLTQFLKNECLTHHRYMHLTSN